MNFGIIKIEMDNETINELSYSHATKLCERMRSQFKVVAKPYQRGSELSLYIAVVMLGKTRDKLTHHRDEILAYIENHGLGRVLEDKLFIEDIDSIDAEDEYED